MVLWWTGVHHGTNRYEIGDIGLDIEYSNQMDLKYHDVLVSYLLVEEKLM